jgi:hypothetical protein
MGHGRSHVIVHFEAAVPLEPTDLVVPVLRTDLITQRSHAPLEAAP